MPGSLLGTFTAADGAGNLTTGSRSTTAGSLVTGHAAGWDDPTAPTISFSDNQSNSYTTTSVVDGLDRISLGYNAAGNRGAGHTVTATFGAGVNGSSVSACEWDGIEASPTVVTNTATGTGTAVSVSVNAGASSSLFVGVMSYGGSTTTIAPSGGATEAIEADENSDNQDHAVAYKAELSGSQSTAWTLGASRAWGAIIAAFTEAGDDGIEGSLSKTLGAATAAGSGTVDTSGSASKTLGTATADGDGSVAISGAADVTLGAATLDAEGTSSDEILGSLDKTLGAASAAGTGTVAIAGSAAKTLGEAAADGDGSVSITGSGSATLGAATVDAAEAAAQAPAAGGDFIPGRDHRGYNLKRAKLRLKKDREYEQSIRQVYRELTADPATRERAEALIAPPIVERDDETPRQHAARVAERDRALRLEQLSAEKEIALRMLHQELRELQHQEDEDAIMQLLGQVL